MTETRWEELCTFAQGLRLFRDVNGEGGDVSDQDIGRALEDAGISGVPLPMLKRLLTLRRAAAQQGVLKEQPACTVLQMASAADFLGSAELVDVCASAYALFHLPNELAREGARV